MKKTWVNVKSDLSIEVGEEKLINKKAILSKFENAIELGGWKFIEWTQKKSSPYQCVVDDGKKNIDILVYLKPISNAGWEDKPECKRVQVGNRENIDVSMLRNESEYKINLIVGVYDYERCLFAAWNSDEYTNHKTNRSCYINVEDIIMGYENGYYKIKRRKQDLYVFSPKNLVKYIKEYIIHDVPIKRAYEVDRNAVLEVANDTINVLKDYEKIKKKFWTGKEKVVELKNEGSRNWKQMEWPGFYFEHIGKEILKKTYDINGIKYGNTTIDLFNQIPWDLKVHTLNVDNPAKVQTNSLEAIYNAIDDYGFIGFIILEGEANWDEDGEFKKWHDDLKEGKSKYSELGEEINRVSRRRKESFKLVGIKIIVMSKSDVIKQPSFQKGMVNSNGNVRNEKMLLDFNLLTNDNVIIDEKI
ncbi:MAG: hypothetical protein PHY08_10755 [Candidatus Cloacimonetes bacterium]|nr:hypothetical protein [Candidatus Cloacimonadota bacterium]